MNYNWPRQCSTDFNNVWNSYFSIFSNYRPMHDEYIESLFAIFPFYKMLKKTGPIVTVAVQVLTDSFLPIQFAPPTYNDLSAIEVSRLPVVLQKMMRILDAFDESHSVVWHSHLKQTYLQPPYVRTIAPQMTQNFFNSLKFWILLLLVQ